MQLCITYSPFLGGREALCKMIEMYASVVLFVIYWEVPNNVQSSAEGEGSCMLYVSNKIYYGQYTQDLFSHFCIQGARQREEKEKKEVATRLLDGFKQQLPYLTGKLGKNTLTMHSNTYKHCVISCPNKAKEKLASIYAAWTI